MTSSLQVNAGQNISGNTDIDQLYRRITEIYPQFKDQDDNFWGDILNTASRVVLPDAKMIMQPNTPCTQFLLLLDGCVRVYQQTPDDREITLYRSYAGDLCVLSMNAMLHRKCFGAFAQTESPVSALMLTREQFMQALASSAIFREVVLTNLTDRIGDVLQLIETTVFENLDTRLICFLNRLSRETGRENLHITHQELARELGTSREVISRILKSFERQGCVVQQRGVITVMP